ncbi:cytochrome P450 family protein [Streptomyces telluris]|uniref:Cytochrome P450 n=1 Tax=Streptomyces telluris TaxID=2720021 RepID=A0A9X2LEM3_9ACTN|nr:cytochrome P450 [Streptomyces telluris]MCQ8769825.1 cytochrome P450 [Streptomyces telluris]NJP76434.1 cytochrome P450 [Streptomyces telluris]
MTETSAPEPSTGPGAQTTEFDLSDPAFITDPAAGERWLSGPRPVCPGKFADGSPIWVATGYQDVRKVLSEPTLRSRPPGDSHRESMLSRGIPEDIVDMFDSTLLTMDGEDHMRVRRLVTRALSARRMQTLTPAINRVAHRLLDDLAAKPEPDLIADYAHPLAIIVICELLGVDEGYREQWREWSETLAAALRPNPEQFAPAVRGMARVTRELIEARQAEPRDDLISELVQIHEQDSERLTDDELVALAMVLVQAGHETVRNLIALGVFTLLQHPDQLKQLKDDPSIAARAVVELVRHTAPVKHTFRRFATEPVEIGGVTVQPGEAIQVVLAAANRDPEEFDRPEALDLTREHNPHLGFGRGAHYCLGASLALIEGEVALNALFERFPDLELAADPAEIAPRYLLSMQRLPVRLSPAPTTCPVTG